MFSSEPPLSFRPEVQKYIRTCEHVLSAFSSPDCSLYRTTNDDCPAIGAVMKD